MRVIFEIENDKDARRVERMLSTFIPEDNETVIDDRRKKIKKFLSFADKMAIKVDKVTIPSREERNVR